jgi:hypothetical protein
MAVVREPAGARLQFLDRVAGQQVHMMSLSDVRPNLNGDIVQLLVDVVRDINGIETDEPILHVTSRLVNN